MKIDCFSRLILFFEFIKKLDNEAE